MEQWVRNNERYWSSLAANYDELYADPWSRREDEFVRNELRWLSVIENCRLLDLGCGTGLGYQICTAINPHVQYTGVDISSEMLKVCKLRFPCAITYQSRMSDLPKLEDSSYDAVISIFTSFSFTDDIQATIAEIRRVLKPGARVLLSCLSRWSLRRLLRGRFGSQERYLTRGTSGPGFSSAWALTRGGFRNCLIRGGFTDIKIIGYNALAGVPLLNRLPFMWEVNLGISGLAPYLSHEVIATARKD